MSAAPAHAVFVASEKGRRALAEAIFALRRSRRQRVAREPRLSSEPDEEGAFDETAAAIRRTPNRGTRECIHLNRSNESLREAIRKTTGTGQSIKAPA